MTARGGQDLLQGALRIHASGRPFPARIDALLSYLIRSLPLSSATIYLPDERQAALSRRFTSTISLKELECLIPFHQGCAGRCAASLAPQSAQRAELHPDEPSAEADAHYLALPVRVGGKLLAVVSVGFPAGAPDAPVRKALEPVLPLVASLASGVRGEEELARRQRHLSLLAELSRLQCIPLAPAKLLPRLLRLCNEAKISRCALVRLTTGKERARVYKSCPKEITPHLPAILHCEAELSASALAHGVPVTEAALEEGAAPPSLCLPLRIGERSFGTLTFWGEPALHAPQQREVAETVGRLLTSALAEATNSERIASCYSHQERQLKELSLLYRMSNTMLSTIKLNKLIHLTLTALTSGPTPFFDRAMLYLANERSGVLQGMLGVTTETAPPLATHGGEDLLASRWDISEDVMAAQQESEFSKEVRGNRLELNRTLNAASRAVLEKKLIFVPEHPEATRGAYAVAPLIAHDKVVGAVSVDNALTGAAITQEDLRYLQLFTNQAGMAIENSILYNRLEDANRQLCETQEHLLQRERLAAIGEMAAGIAHELKNPLVAIGGFAGRLARKLSKDSGEWMDADLIVREVMRLEAILSEILFFSKKSGTCYVRCNLKQIVRESLQVIAPGLQERRIGVSTRFCRKPLHLSGDPQQLKQVFINILSNAQDAMSKGGGQLKVVVALAELDGKEGASVRISDTGGGIPLEGLHSIFTPFYTTKEKGTGLGLPIANRIILNHGGKIQVHNKAGVGAEFTILLPLQQ